MYLMRKCNFQQFWIQFCSLVNLRKVQQRKEDGKPCVTSVINTNAL